MVALVAAVALVEYLMMSKKALEAQVAAVAVPVRHTAETAAVALVERLTEDKVELQMDLVLAAAAAEEPLHIGQALTSEVMEESAVVDKF